MLYSTKVQIPTLVQKYKILNTKALAQLKEELEEGMRREKERAALLANLRKAKEAQDLR